MSNFYRKPIQFNGIHWPSVEYAYQAYKSFDPNDWLLILNCNTSGEARRVGQTLPLRPNWDKMKRSVMQELIRIKFAFGSELAEKLIRTFPHTLVEGNYWHDNFFGSCVCSKCEKIPKLNHLGGLLAERRTELMTVYGSRVEIEITEIPEMSVLRPEGPEASSN